jgi:hypothetical protein
MMNFLACNRSDNRLAHLAPFQGVRLVGSFPGLKPRAESRPQRFRVAKCGQGLLPLRGREPAPKILMLARAAAAAHALPCLYFPNASDTAGTKGRGPPVPPSR